MEREPSPMYNSLSAVRSLRAPPVLQMKVPSFMTGEEAPGNGAGSLGSTTTTAGHSAINFTRAATNHNFSAHIAGSGSASTTRRVMADATNPNNSAFSLTAANGTGSATSSSSLAKPVLDPCQVRCCPLDQWVPDAHVMNCMAPDCTNNFSLFNRKHRCRMCGRVFCSSCCNNVVYVAAAAGMAMPTGLSETAGMNGSNNNNSSIHHTSNNTANSSAMATTEPAGAGANAGGLSSNPSSGGAAANGSNGAGGVNCSSSEGNSAGSTSPGAVTLSTTNLTMVESNKNGFMSGGGNSNINTAGATQATTSMVSSPVTASVVLCRVCASCFYEVQLVVSTRQENGELRRRSRGELKMLQRALLVNVMTYLNLLDLASVALVSADFYFLSRDNVIWYQYNMTRWAQEKEEVQLSSLKSRAAALRAQQQRATSWYGGGGASSLADDIFNSTAVIQDATALSESEAAKRVISLHARYNYTQFLDFARRQEMARCEGLSSFSLGARILLSSPIRVALIGPSGIGKTAAVQAFLGEKPTQMVVRPTIGFQRRVTSVRLTGDLSTEATLHLYDLSGADRYEELRRFVCRHCHVLALCYDPAQKVTLVQAADIMMTLEPALGPQPVVVCGLLRKGSRHASRTNSENGKVEIRSTQLTSSRSASIFDGGVPKKTLALGEHNAQSLPVRSDNAAAVTMTTTASGAANTTGSAISFPEMSRSGVCSPAAVGSSTNSSGVDDTAAASADGRGASSSRVGVSSSNANALPTGAAAVAAFSTDVSVEDAVGITVRGLSSIQCPMMQPTPLFEAVVQAVLDRLGEATLASTTTISEISAELSSQGEFSTSASSVNRGTASTANRSVPASVARSSARRRRPAAASRTIVQDLLNLTMQPCALDILLDRK